MCGREKIKEKKMYGWKKGKIIQRIRNYNSEMLPQYFHSIFTKNLK